MDGVPLTFLVETLRKEALSVGEKLRGVSHQIVSVSKDVEFFQAKLEKWAKGPVTDPELKVLVRRFRHAVYEIQGILQDYFLEKAKYESKNKIKKILIHPLEYPHKLLDVARRIGEIKTEVNEIQKNLKTVEELPVGETSRRGQILPPVDENYLVGFIEEQKIIKNYLSGGSDELEVIAIFGMTGLGKSTLADWILRNPAVASEFNKCIWVPVSQNFSRREVFRRILKHFTELDDNIRGMDARELVEQLHIFLTRYSYLIVMDDVCTIEDWENLKAAFPKTELRSRILLTTCLQNVAKHANCNREPVLLKFLSDDESWELLKRKVFGLMECPEELMEHGKNIAKECAGLPQAIVLMGGILLDTENDSCRWRDVSKNVGSYIVPNKPGETKVTDFSFYQLPYPLKACFLYVGNFPKGSKIPVKKLISFWIVEGFVEKEENKSLKNTAKEYLNHLVNKRLFMTGKLGPTGKVKTVYVHDVVYEFCKRKAAEEDLYHVVENNDTGSDKYYRISIHSSSVLESISTEPVGTRAWSFLFSFPEDITLQPTQTINLLKYNKSLRVFDGKSIIFPHFPPHLAQSVHLRYLVLHMKDKILPECLSDFWNLQTLIVHSPSEHTLEIKADALKMSRLTHLQTNASTSWPSLSKRKKKKEVFPGLRDLKTLSMVSPETCTKDAFERAPNLNKLGIRGPLAKLFKVNSDGHSLFDNVIGLGSLENLTLFNDVLDPSNSESQIIDFPGEFPKELKKLTLIDIQLDEKIMSTLGMLENLETLELENITFKELKWVMNTCFPNLKVLHIEKAVLRFWEASKDHFPKLRHLCLVDCTHLSKIPFGLAGISTFEAMELERITISAARSAEEIEKQKTDGGKPFKLSIYSAA